MTVEEAKTAARSFPVQAWLLMQRHPELQPHANPTGPTPEQPKGVHATGTGTHGLLHPKQTIEYWIAPASHRANYLLVRITPDKNCHRLSIRGNFRGSSDLSKSGIQTRFLPYASWWTRTGGSTDFWLPLGGKSFSSAI